MKISRLLQSILVASGLMGATAMPQMAQAATAYDWTHTVQQTVYEGTTTQQQTYLVSGGYYDTIQVQTGTTQVCTTTTKTVNHATQYGHWVETGYWSKTQNAWVCPNGSCGYWVTDGWGPPYYNTYETVTTCTNVPVYTTEQVYMTPVYGTRTVTVPVYSTTSTTVTTAIQPPTITGVTITPNPAMPSDKLQAIVQSTDPANYPVYAQKWTITGPGGTQVTSSFPKQLPAGQYNISVQVQNTAPDGTPAAWSDPYQLTFDVGAVAKINGISVTNIVHPPVGIALPEALPVSTPIAVKSGYNITLHVASQGAGTLSIHLYVNGQPIDIGYNNGTVSSEYDTQVPDGGADVTFFIPETVTQGSVIDLKAILTCSFGNSVSTDVKQMNQTFAVKGSAYGDTLVNRNY